MNGVVLRWAGLALVLVAFGVGMSSTDAARAANDFRSLWDLSPGFNLTIDTEGYELPTAIAFVPHPGDGPKSPLYFVAELRGTIKVVTRDRTVLTFADLGLRKPQPNYPALGAQNGAAGICLDERHGYVFVSYAAFDSSGVLRNGMVRLSSTPGTFSLRASGSRNIGRIFAPYPTSANHQIGGCVVVGDALFVGVGDGAASSRAQDLDQLSGKIVRMTLDGKPAPGNPFVADEGPRRYVWSYGLRNPFGLTAVGRDVYATQNGNSIDSFLAVTRGQNYGWDGTDATIAANAEAVFAPAIAPVHVAYYAGGLHFPAEYRGSFFFASAESSASAGAGVWSLGYDVSTGVVTSPAASVVRYRGPAGGEVSGLALGPDGVYFAPLLPQDTPTAAVYKLTYDPSARYPHRISAAASGSVLFEQLGCRSCHSLNNVGGSVGPALDRGVLVDPLEKRLSSDAYRDRVAQLDREGGAEASREARASVLAESGEDRVVEWVKQRVLDPKFDDPNAAMPRVGATDAEAAAVADYLVRGSTDLLGGGSSSRSFAERSRDVVTSKKFAGGVVVGFGFAAMLVVLGVLATRRRARLAPPR